MTDAEDTASTVALKFPPGTVVQLKIGGPKMVVSQMVVSQTVDGKIWVSFWEIRQDYLSFGGSQKSLQSRSFHPDMLVICQEDGK